MSEEKIIGEVPDLKAEDIFAPLSHFDELSDDEILYWSTPYGLELEAERETRKKQLEEEKLK